jgi:hypothetical protein
MLKSKYISEQVGVTPGKVKIDGKEYSVSNITSDSIKLNDIDFVIVSSTDSQLGLYNKDFNDGSVFYIDNTYDGIENNIRDKMKYLGKDDSYLYFKLDDSNIFYA